ncbi:MAG: right-handed parallel beta-helix repeat-containing protein [Victivallales bacterium]|nr:right-handed parallel beta-helix repeat-containing protein [Victivallales bacterium]
MRTMPTQNLTFALLLSAVSLLAQSGSFLPIGGKPFTGDFGELPKGAEEFEVERPRPTGGAVVKASDFGFSQSNDHNFASLNQAIAFCRANKASVLELAPGDYRCLDDDTPIHLANLQDLTLDGKGARLVCWRTKNVSLHIEGCDRVVVKNLKFDWDWEREPLASLVEVVAVAPEHYDLKFLHYEDYPAKTSRMAFLSPWDPALKSIGYEGDQERALEMYIGRNKPDIEWISGNVMRIKSGPGRFQVGQQYRLQHYYYDMNCILMSNNRHLTLEDVDILSTPGHATLITGQQKYTQFLRVNIRPPQDDERRVISCTADHCHIGQSLGYFKLLNCDFCYGSDDCLNVHDGTAFCRKTGENSVTTQNARSTGWTFVPDAPLELRQGDYSPSGFREPIQSVKTIDEKKGVYEITFAKPVPEQKYDGFILFNWNYNTHNVILRDCFFHDNRARGVLLLAHDITVERCRFRHNQMGALKIETGYTLRLWSEGYGASNIVVRNCSFEQSNPSEVRNGNWVRDIYMGVYIKTDPSSERTRYPILHDILFENNTFTDSYGLIAFISSAGNVTFRNNLFRNPQPRKHPHSYRGCFYLTHADNVKIVNNTYISSPHVPKPGVYFDPETVTNCIVTGNTLAHE